MWPRKWIVALVAVVTVAATIAASSLASPSYTSTARVLVRAINVNPQAQSSAPGSLATELMLARSLPVATLASGLLAAEVKSGALPAVDAHAVQQPGALLGHVTVTVPTGSLILLISYTDSTARLAQAGAQAFAQAYLQFRQGQARQMLAARTTAIESQIAGAQATINRDQRIAATNPASSPKAIAAKTQVGVLAGEISVLENELGPLTAVDTTPGGIIQPAGLPGSASGPNRILLALVGLILGLALGIGAALLLERIPSRVRSQADLEELLGAPVLVAVPPTARRKLQSGALTKAAPKSGAAEAYRSLAALTGYLSERQGLKTLLVTSAERGDGRTVTATNLAAAARLAGKRVALVSADFGDPGFQKVLGVNGSRSLGDVLTGSIKTRDALQEVDGVMVLTSKLGPQTPQGLLLRTDRMAAVLADLRGSADLVVIDAPPVESADTLAVAPLSDGVLFVAKADKTAPQAIERARARLGMLHANVVGGVLTDVDPAQDRARARSRLPIGGSGPSEHATAAPDGNGHTPSAV